MKKLLSTLFEILWNRCAKKTTLVKYLDATKKNELCISAWQLKGLKSLHGVGGVCCQQTAKLELIPLSCPSACLPACNQCCSL